MLVLGISGSPRRGGNTETLLDEALAGAAEAGADTVKVVLCGISVSPCISCGECDITGQCPIDDDMQRLYEQIAGADALIFASPVYFYSVSAWAKAVIDRAQALWSRRYVLKEPAFNRNRKGAFIAVGATSGKKLFDGIRLTVRYFFDAAGFAYTSELLIRRMDGKDAVRGYPEFMRAARETGAALAAGDQNNSTG